MSTYTSWMALVYRMTASFSRVYHVSQEKMLLTGWGFQPAPEERRLETGMTWSTEPGDRATASLEKQRQRWHLPPISWRLSRRGKKLPRGMGRDKTAHSLRVILPDTWASSSLLPPTESPSPSGMKNSSITWHQVNMSPTTTVTTVRWAPGRDVPTLALACH